MNDTYLKTGDSIEGSTGGGFIISEGESYLGNSIYGYVFYKSMPSDATFGTQDDGKNPSANGIVVESKTHYTHAKIASTCQANYSFKVTGTPVANEYTYANGYWNQLSSVSVSLVANTYQLVCKDKTNGATITTVSSTFTEAGTPLPALSVADSFVQTNHPGYHCSGWMKDNEVSYVSYIPATETTSLSYGNSINIFLKTAPNTCKVVFNGNGGTVGTYNEEDYTVSYSDGVTSIGNLNAVSATKTGYEFKGWTESVAGAGDSISSVTADYTNAENLVTVYAIWEKNPTNSTNPTEPTEPANPTNSSDTNQITKEQASSFVTRMYNDALGRNAEQAGLDDWVHQLVEQKVDGAGMAKGFICSKEFTEKNLNNEAYVKVLYTTFFGREADAAGLKNWVDKLNSGTPRTEILAGFVNSKEFTNICDESGIVRGTMEADGSSIYNSGVNGFVNRMYNKCLSRKGECEGVEYWTYNINKKSLSPEEVAKRFYLSEEYTKKNVSDEVFVESLYETFMGRSSDAEGKAYWLNNLKSGMTRETVLEGFSRSKEFSVIMKEFGL